MKVKWITAYEKNNEHFEVERSSDRMETKVIGMLPGFGNTQLPQSYSLYDDSPLVGENYYRIKQVDFNGSSSYSSWVSVNFNQVMWQSGIWPNPTEGAVQINGVSEGNQVKIFDAAGRLLIDREAEHETLQLDLGRLEPGVYTVNVYAGGKLNKSEKLIKK